MSDTEIILNAATSDFNKMTFLLGSGTTDHIVNELDVFSNIMDLAEPLKISIGKKEASITASKRRTIDILTSLGFKRQLKDVLYAP